MKKKIVSFEKTRVTKDYWEDSACSNCLKELWEGRKVKYAYETVFSHQGYFALCEDCFGELKSV